MTRKTYIATIDSYIPLASAWADREIGLTNGKQRCGNKWIRHFAFAMDEARRRLGMKHSYDLAPELLRPPHGNCGKYGPFEMAKYLTTATSSYDLENRFCDVRTAKEFFNASTYAEAVDAAKTFLQENNLGKFMADYRARLNAHFDAQYLDKAG